MTVKGNRRLLQPTEPGCADRERSAVDDRPVGGLRAVSLFTGAGGLDIAACRTGYVKALFSTDSHPVFLGTAQKNIAEHFPEVEHCSIVADGATLKGSEIAVAFGNDPIDVVFGGPPCDDFTKYGRRLGPRGDKAALIFSFSRLVSELGPRSFIFENVPNLVGQFSSTFDEFLESFDSRYTYRTAVLTAGDYGAATSRKRLFVVGFREEDAASRFSFPRPTHGLMPSQASLLDEISELLPPVTVRQVLEDLPDVKTVEGARYLNHVGRTHRPETVQHLMTVPQGVSISKSFRYRAPWEGLCRSLTAGLNDSTKSYIHPIYHREMSVREYARIHGFPDSWYFEGTHHNGIKQVANAVPIPLGYAVFRSVAQSLRETSPATSST